jgi:PKD repeat protein
VDAGARPRAEFAVRPRRPYVGQSLELLDASSDPTGAGIAWRAWDFGDDATATGSSPSHRYATAGTYTITLTVATFDGRIATTTRRVRVRPSGRAGGSDGRNEL